MGRGYILLFSFIFMLGSLYAFSPGRHVKKRHTKSWNWQKELDALAEKRRLELEGPPPEQPKSRYIPPEKMNTSSTSIAESIAWEERVRFDCLREGNMLRQNEILQRQLGSEG